jgi:hypothetical protein
VIGLSTQNGIRESLEAEFGKGIDIRGVRQAIDKSVAWISHKANGPPIELLLGYATELIRFRLTRAGHKIYKKSSVDEVVRLNEELVSVGVLEEDIRQFSLGITELLK